MATLSGGSLYYTVNVDRASLQRAIKDVRALGNAVDKQSGQAKEGNSVLRRMAQEAALLANRVTQLKADFDSNKISHDKMMEGLRGVQGAARGLRGELETTGAESIETAGDASYFQSVLTRLASVLKQTSASTAESEGKMDMLGDSFQRLRNDIDRVGIEMRSLRNRFEAGEIGIAEYTREMGQLIEYNKRYKASLSSMTGALNLSNKQMKQQAQAFGQVTRNAKAGQQAITRATGKFQSLAIAQQLSYGATTLLNDKIFQLSPALGILTNQLIFTTQGMRAFLVSALPIVAVAGTIIAVVSTLVMSLKSGAGLEAALADVRKTTNLVEEDLYKLTDAFQELSNEIPMTTRELLDIAVIAGQLGITGVRNIERFSEAVAKLAIATDVVGEEGATSLARFLQATGTAKSELGDIANQVGNILNELENTTAATAAQILKMTSYTQGLSSQANATRPEILGLNAALLSLGVKAEAGGSAVVRTVGKIQKAAVDGGAEFARFADAAGMTVDEFQRVVDASPVQALVALAGGLNETAEQGGNLNQVLSDLGINEVRERRALLALAQGADTLEEAMANANREALEMLSVNAEVAIQADTVESKLKRLGNRFRTIGQDLGTILLPALHVVIDVLIVLTDKIGFFFEKVVSGLDRLDEMRNGLRDIGDEAEEAKRSIDEASSGFESATTVMGKLAEVTGENGLVGAIQDFAASLNEDGRTALADFVASTVKPLLSQGKFQEALVATINYMRDYRVEAARTALASAEAYSEVLFPQVKAARQNLGPAREKLAAMEPLVGLQYEAERRALRRDIAEYELVLAEWESQVRTLSELREQVRRAEGQANEIMQIDSLEELRQWLRDNLGITIPGVTDGGDRDDGDGDLSVAQKLEREIDKLQELVAVGAIDSQGYYEALMSQLERAIRDGIDEGVPQNVLRYWQAWYDSIAQTLAQSVDPLSVDLPVPEPLSSVLGSGAPMDPTPGRANTRSGGFRPSAGSRTLGMSEDGTLEVIGDQAALARELHRLREEEASDVAYWEQRKIEMRENTSAIVRNIVEGDTRATTRAIEAEREALEANDRYWASRAERMRKRNAARIRERDRVLGEEIAAGNRAAEARLAQAEAAGEMTDSERALREQASSTYETYVAMNEILEKYDAEVESIRGQLEAGYITAAQAAEMETASMARRIEELGELVGWTSDRVKALIEELRRLEKAKPIKIPEPDPEVEVLPSTLQVISERLKNIGDTVPGVVGEIASALSSVTEGADTIITGFAMMADGSENSTETIVKGVGTIASGLLALLPVQESVANQMIEGFFGAAGAVAELVTGIPGLGQAISAVGSVFSRILGDMSNGLRQIAEQVDDFVSGSSYLNESLVQAFADMATETVSRGGILGWLGFTKRQLDEELFGLLTSIATGLAGGIAGAINQGIMDGLAGGDWRESLQNNLKKAIVDSVIQAFVETAIMKGVFNDFFLQITEMIAEGEIGKAMSYAERVFPKLLDTAANVVEDFLDVIPPEFREAYEQDGAGSSSGGTKGTRISEITGPTRDLLIDLLRPLAVMPSWTSMIRDIRNDVRKIAQGSSSMGLPPIFGGVQRSEWMYSRAAAGTGITVGTMYVQSSANNTRELVRDISRHTFKERRGGK